MGLISNGTSLFDAGSLAAGLGGGMTFIKKLSGGSSVSTMSFLNGANGVVFDSTYSEYLFIFNNIHPQTDNKDFTFQVDTGTNTSYNQYITSTYWAGYNNEANDTQGQQYVAAYDLAQGTAFQTLSDKIDAANDASMCGFLRIYGAGSSSFVKNFEADCICMGNSTFTTVTHAAGYVNTTTALTRIQFKMSSGDMEAGTISMYGISK